MNYQKNIILFGIKSALIQKKKNNSEPVYNKEYLKTKIKSHHDEVTDFYDKKIPKMDSNHTCLAVISLNSALKKDDNYYLQVFLKECKYIEKKVVRHIHDNLSDFSYSSFESDEDQMFSDKYLSLKHKRTQKVQNVESYYFNLFIINQILDKVNHLSFKAF